MGAVFLEPTYTLQLRAQVIFIYRVLAKFVWAENLFPTTPPRHSVSMPKANGRQHNGAESPHVKFKEKDLLSQILANSRAIFH